MAHADLGDQPLEAVTVGGRGTRLAWSVSMTMIWVAVQPSAIARPRRSYWRWVDSVSRIAEFPYCRSSKFPTLPAPGWVGWLLGDGG
jgi:hypothetical protein